MSSILVYTSSYPNILQPYRGFFVKEQIDAVKRYLNCSFAIVAPVESTKKREFEREEKDIYRPVYFYPPIPKVLIPFRGLMMLYASQPVLEGLFKQNRFDLVHIHFAYPGGFAISYLKKKFRVPVVLTVHGSDIFRYPKYPFLGWQIRALTI
jgi:glycosyltransferase involved in cell wall biosynthesis